MINDEAADAAIQAGRGSMPKDANLEDIAAKIPTGYSINNPKVQAAMQDYISSPAYLLTSALGGGGAGAAAAQGSLNPVAAMLQGFRAGISVPSQVYEMKKQQLQSTLDATPLAQVLPDLAQRYPVFAGMPSKIALESIQQIANDVRQVRQAGAVAEAQAKGRRAAEIATPEAIEKAVKEVNDAGIPHVEADDFKGLTNSELENRKQSFIAGAKAQYENTAKVIGDFNAEVQKRSFDDVKTAFQSMKDYADRVASDPQEHTDPGDEAFKIAFIKVTRPYFTRPIQGEADATYLERLKQAANRFYGKGPLTNDKIREFMKEAGAQWKQTKQDIADVHSRYKRLAKDPTEFDRIYPLSTLIDVKSSFTLPDPQEAINKQQQPKARTLPNPFDMPARGF